MANTQGNTARQMAATPLPSQTDQKTTEKIDQAPPAPVRNRFETIFGRVVFSLPTGANKPYPYEGTNTVQHRLAQVSVELGNTGHYITGFSVVALVDGDSKDARIEGKGPTISQGPVRKSIFHSDDSASVADFKAWIAAMADQCLVWRAAQSTGRGAFAVGEAKTVDRSALGI